MPHCSAPQPTSPYSRQSAKQHLIEQVNLEQADREFAEDQPTDESEERRSKLNSSLSNSHRRKALWAGGVITLLAMATILPTQVSSQAITSNKCEKVIKSGSEISRAQLSNLASIPEGSTREALRQVVLEPYCILPVQTQNEETPQETSSSSTDYLLQKEAYPLAFDRDAWLVVTYQGDEYKGYDFVFKR